MDLKTYVSERGRQTWLAQQIEAQPQLVWQWANGVKPVPADRCPGIERATEGSVTCEEMRGDVRWARVPDPLWPHQEGRPTIDVAAPPAAESASNKTAHDHADASAGRTSDADRRNAEQARMLKRALITRDGPSKERGGRHG
jgi:DNA-binding transcriptional regulator YdaS (Cro superfamily)